MLDEQALELDDVRWYCAEQLASEFISLSDRRDEITRRIWSGELERTLRSLDESYIRRVEDEYERRLLDDTDLNRIVNEILSAKKRRNRS